MKLQRSIVFPLEFISKSMHRICTELNIVISEVNATAVQGPAIRKAKDPIQGS